MGDRLGIHGAVDTFTSLGSDQYLAEERKKETNKKHTNKYVRVRGEPPLDLAFYSVRQFHLVVFCAVGDREQ